MRWDCALEPGNLNPGQVQHLPPSVSLGPHKGFNFYQGQPTLCWECREEGHLTTQYPIKICTMYKEKGHPPKDYKQEWQ